MRVFLDVNVVMYAAGSSHPYREPSAQLLRRIAQGELDVVTDAEVLQELLYRYWHLNALSQGLTLVERVVGMMPDILPVTAPDMVLATTLLRQHRRLEPRDAVHAGVMLSHGITHLYSYDRLFETIPGFTRLEP